MTFYLKPLSIYNFDQCVQMAEKYNHNFFSFNGDLIYKTQAVGKLENCIDENGGLKTDYIFDTNHKFWTQEKAIEVFKESGYPFMTWNGRVYDKDFHEVATMQELGIGNQTSKVFNTNHKMWGHIDRTAEFVKTTGYPQMNWNGSIYDLKTDNSLETTSKVKMKIK